MILAGSSVGLLLAGALYQFIGVRRGARRYPPPGTMVDVDRQRLHVVCAGNGWPAVLFESGIAASSLSWTRVLHEVGTFTRACAYNRAGFGWSAASRGPRTMARMLRELRGVWATAGSAGPAVLVGHSFGAWLVSAYTSQHPADVAGLVLLDPPSEWCEITPGQERLLRGGIHLSRIGAMLARLGVVRVCLAFLTGGAPAVPRNFVRIFGPAVARTLERLVGEVQKLPPEVHPIVQEVWCQPKCFRAMADHLAAMKEAAAVIGCLTDLPDVPLVIISGRDQPSQVLVRHRQLANLSSGGRHIVAATSGHWIQFDQPDLVVETIRDLVDRTRRANAPCSSPEQMHP